jgi:hypothetical protein
MRKTLTAAATAIALLGSAQAASAAVVPANDHWGVVNRNVIGAASAELRTGPATPPFGRGSVNFTVANGQSKMAYGNEIDYVGTPLASINTLAFSVFTTGENRTIALNNLPSVGMEIDPSGPTNTAGLNFSTMTSLPTDAPANVWSRIDASAGQWFLTGAAGNVARAGGTTGCNQATPCTLTEIKATFPDATLISAQITKGRDFEWHGAVDGFQINDQIIDFEVPQQVPGPQGPAGPAGPQGPAGPAGNNGVGVAGPQGPVTAVPAPAAPTAQATCSGNIVRTLRAPSRKGERFVSARATLNGRKLVVKGRAITVDLRNRAEGNYNVRITARYRTSSGRVHTVKTVRGLSVACS